MYFALILFIKGSKVIWAIVPKRLVICQKI